MSDPTAVTEYRLLIDPAAPGAWNMAVDEVLLDWAAQGGGCCWRFYRWSEPTLSLGYFQAYEDRRRHPPSRSCPVVRRLTGGGAIVHDRELTYSFAVPSGHRLALWRDRLYQTIHTTLIEALADLGITATLSTGRQQPAQAAEPFLCFQRRLAGDVLVGRTKIAGSAQRRRRGAVLQHGSVLLQCSEAAPELESLEEATGKAVRRDQLLDAWLPRLSQRLALPGHKDSLSEPKRQQAVDLVETRYAWAGWTEARGR